MDQWHLDKKVTLALIFALLINAGGSVWWASKLDATVQNHEGRITENTLGIRSNSVAVYEIKEGVARIEEGQKYQIDMLKDVRAKVNK